MVSKKKTDSEIAMEHVTDEKAELVTADIGSFNIKLEAAENIYENRFIMDNEGEKYGSETLEYNGNTYFFGKGKFDLTYGKAFKNIEVPLLYAMGKENKKGNIKLILHLPTSQMGNKSMLVEKLQGNTFKYKVNDEKTKSVTFKTVGVLKEGFSSFYSLAKRNKGMIAIVDIGGRTIDVFAFIDGVLVAEISVPIGTMDFFTDIAEHLTLETGEKHELEDIHTLVKHKVIDLNDFEDITNKVFNDVKNRLKIKMDKLNNYQIKLCGGGAEYFEKNFKNEYDNVSVLDNNLTSNVDGAAQIGKAKGLDK